ncbi:MAG TPA: SGNH/GDSL hydrolase family protein, partial [Puia sp.]|nr:SGNH/GDSL hydrolase family protein [Puia sp.]
FLFAAVCLRANAQVSPFVKGDRVAFVGNSITEAGYYESYIWLYYMLHFPEMPITVYNAGIGGDRASNILDRLDDDVLRRKPTVISLTFGMNDSGYFEFLKNDADSTADVRVKESYEKFVRIQQKLKAYTPARKVMVSSSPYDETVKNPKNLFPKKSLAMEKITAFQQTAARQNNWGWVDLFHPMTEIEQREQKRDPEFTLTGNDRIHPGNMGHFVMAWLFLKAQGLTGKKVASAGVDAATAKVTRAENCTVSGVQRGNGGLRFDYLAKSLPFPADTVSRIWQNPQRQSDALKVIPFEEEFNQEILQVKGLKEGMYAVSMDGKRIGEWPGEELGNGINMAVITSTPQYQQAVAVMLLNEERMAIENRMRAYFWLQYDFFRGKNMMYADDQHAMDSVEAYAKKDWAVASKRDNYRSGRFAVVREGWQRQMDTLINEIYTVNKPAKHTIKIEPIR